MKRREDLPPPLAPLFGGPSLNRIERLLVFNAALKTQCCRSARITEAVVKTRSQQRRQASCTKRRSIQKPVEKTMQDQYILALDQGTRNLAKSIRNRAGSSMARRKSGRPRLASPPKLSHARV